MNWRDRTIDDLAKMICGDFAADKSFFKYRSSYYLTQFFRDADTDHTHDGTTRARWVAQTLRTFEQAERRTGRVGNDRDLAAVAIDARCDQYAAAQRYQFFRCFDGVFDAHVIQPMRMDIGLVRGQRIGARTGIVFRREGQMFGPVRGRRFEDLVVEQILIERGVGTPPVMRSLRQGVPATAGSENT